jgi:hypothetical protein
MGRISEAVHLGRSKLLPNGPQERGCGRHEAGDRRGMGGARGHARPRTGRPEDGAPAGVATGLPARAGDALLPHMAAGMRRHPRPTDGRGKPLPNDGDGR